MGKSFILKGCKWVGFYYSGLVTVQLVSGKVAKIHMKTSPKNFKALI